jgi:hypothetical protein
LLATEGAPPIIRNRVVCRRRFTRRRQMRQEIVPSPICGGHATRFNRIA